MNNFPGFIVVSGLTLTLVVKTITATVFAQPAQAQQQVPTAVAPSSVYLSCGAINTGLGGVNCLTSLGLLSNIKPSRIEVQSIAQGNHQQLMARVGTTFNKQFYLKYGQIADLRTEGIEIKFSKVIEDSRCPTKVTCIWAGRVTIGLDIIKNGRKFSTLMLTLLPGNDASATQSFDKYTVTLREVLPYPKSGQRILSEDYIAKIVVSKN
ncbi:MAG: hypothetical protein V7L05_19000 [Nostoc sp.]|uniref:hypothetical protein n=1 Tax=Nostoc sp. TaxID=1180 RepID=UPI002FF94348